MTDPHGSPASRATLLDAPSGGGGPAGADDAPETPEENTWLSLGVKMALAMFLADLVARLLGFENPTWAVISAAFLATGAPIGSFASAARRLGALAVGLALGTTGALLGDAFSGVPSLHFALLGLVAGAIGSRSSDYLFAAVVGTVVTFAGGDDPLPEVIATTACMVAIGCAVGPAVVWGVERAKGLALDGRG